MPQYTCKNLGVCSKADAGEIIDLAPGTDQKCPDCGMTLHETEKLASRGGSGGEAKWLIPAVLAGVVALGGGGWYAYSTYLAQAVSPADVLTKKADNRTLDTAKTAGIAQMAEAVVAPSGRPDDAQIQSLKQQSDDGLVKGDSAAAQLASRRAAALEMIKTAIAHMQQGDLAKAEKELDAAAMQDPDQPLVDYNRAVVRVKQKRTDDALAALETSFAKGFKGFSEMVQDPDMVPLKADARFQGLVTKYQK